MSFITFLSFVYILRFYYWCMIWSMASKVLTINLFSFENTVFPFLQFFFFTLFSTGSYVSCKLECKNINYIYRIIQKFYLYHHEVKTWPLEDVWSKKALTTLIPALKYLHRTIQAWRTNISSRSNSICYLSGDFIFNMSPHKKEIV